MHSTKICGFSRGIGQGERQSIHMYVCLNNDSLKDEELDINEHGQSEQIDSHRSEITQFQPIPPNSTRDNPLRSKVDESQFLTVTEQQKISNFVDVV